MIYGARNGLSASRDQIWSQQSRGVAGAAERYDRFGLALAVGDFNGDRRHDLAVGVPYEDVGRQVDAGAVDIIMGGPRGLWGGNGLWHQNVSRIIGEAEGDDRFGAALA